MSKRYAGRRRRRKSTDGWFLTAAVVLIAGLSCALSHPPQVAQVASVFSPGGQRAAAGAASVTLPEKSWYLVEYEGQAIAACSALLEAEITRAAQGELASIRMVATEEIDLLVTASAAQVNALRRSADALSHTFETLEKMAHLSEFDATATAAHVAVELDKLCDTLDKALVGTENPVVRGLAGLAGSCREAMVDLSASPTKERAQKKLALLALQYEAYTQYLSGQNAAEK